MSRQRVWKTQPRRRRGELERKRFGLQFNLFNVLNGNGIFAANNAIGSSLGQGITILMGRLPRVAFQMQW